MFFIDALFTKSIVILIFLFFANMLYLAVKTEQNYSFYKVRAIISTQLQKYEITGRKNSYHHRSQSWYW